MTTVRCRACDAAVPADAAWCTLCFTALRPEAPAPAPAAPAHAVVAPVAFAPAAAGPLPAVATLLEDSSPTWPCNGCAERVPLEAMVCSNCGAAFLGGVNPDVSFKIPGVGDVVGMSKGAKFGLMAGGAAVLTTAFVLLLVILGHIF